MKILVGLLVIAAVVFWSIFCLVHLFEAADGGDIPHTLLWGFLLLSSSVGGISTRK